MPVQRQKQLPVRKKPGYLVGRVHRQGCLTDSRHATYRVNFYHAVSVGGRLLKVPQLFISAGKRSGGTRQGPDYCGSVRTPESCGLEILALVTGQDGAVVAMLALEDLVRDLVGLVRDGTPRA